MGRKYQFFYAVLLPPTSTNERRVEERQGPAFVLCDNTNSPEVANVVQWFRVSDPGTILSTRFRLTFNFPVSRLTAGEYECRVVSRINGETAAARSTLIVECKLCYRLCCLLFHHCLCFSVSFIVYCFVIQCYDVTKLTVWSLCPIRIILTVTPLLK